MSILEVAWRGTVRSGAVFSSQTHRLTQCWVNSPNAGAMLIRRRRRRVDIDPALGPYIVLAGFYSHCKRHFTQEAGISFFTSRATCAGIPVTFICFAISIHAFFIVFFAVTQFQISGCSCTLLYIRRSIQSVCR